MGEQSTVVDLFSIECRKISFCVTFFYSVEEKIPQLGPNIEILNIDNDKSDENDKCIEVTNTSFTPAVEVSNVPTNSVDVRNVPTTAVDVSNVSTPIFDASNVPTPTVDVGNVPNDQLK